MKNENIPAEVKSKSLKEARDEINDILNKLERKDADLTSSIDDNKRLIHYRVEIVYISSCSPRQALVDV